MKNYLQDKKQILKPNTTYSGLSYQLQKVPALKWFIVNFEIWADLGTFKKQQEEKKPESTQTPKQEEKPVQKQEEISSFRRCSSLSRLR